MCKDNRICSSPRWAGPLASERSSHYDAADTTFDSVSCVFRSVCCLQRSASSRCLARITSTGGCENTHGVVLVLFLNNRAESFLSEMLVLLRDSSALRAVLHLRGLSADTMIVMYGKCTRVCVHTRTSELPSQAQHHDMSNRPVFALM